MGRIVTFNSLAEVTAELEEAEKAIGFLDFVAKRLEGIATDALTVLDKHNLIQELDFNSQSYWEKRKENITEEQPVIVTQ